MKNCTTASNKIDQLMDIYTIAYTISMRISDNGYYWCCHCLFIVFSIKSSNKTVLHSLYYKAMCLTNKWHCPTADFFRWNRQAFFHLKDALESGSYLVNLMPWIWIYPQIFSKNLFSKLFSLKLFFRKKFRKRLFPNIFLRISFSENIYFQNFLNFPKILNFFIF